MRETQREEGFWENEEAHGSPVNKDEVGSKIALPIIAKARI